MFWRHVNVVVVFVAAACVRLAAKRRPLRPGDRRHSQLQLQLRGLDWCAGRQGSAASKLTPAVMCLLVDKKSLRDGGKKGRTLRPRLTSARGEIRGHSRVVSSCGCCGMSSGVAGCVLRCAYEYMWRYILRTCGRATCRRAGSCYGQDDKVLRQEQGRDRVLRRADLRGSRSQRQQTIYSYSYSYSQAGKG